MSGKQESARREKRRRPLINDNRQPEEWPESRIASVRSIPNEQGDLEPYAQRLNLSCGHWCVNTWGFSHRERKPGETLRCRTCAERAHG